MNFVFISEGNYPDNHAETIRHSIIAQGISENGHEVIFLVLNPQNWKSTEMHYKGFIYKALNGYSGNSKIIKVWNFANVIFRLKKELKSINKKTPIDGIIVYATNIFIIHQVLSIGKKLSIKIFHERTELPNIIGISHTLFGRIKYYYYINKLVPEFNGIFVISDKLFNFFLPHNRNIKKILTVVNTDFFTVRCDPVFDFPYIAYCGTMKGEKDGVPILIQSFAKLVNHFPNIKLLLIGNNSDKFSMRETNGTIENLNLKEKVMFTGFVTREEMPGLLGNAVLLVVSKPDNEQNSANFPIKIGEYLSTGVPIVVTKVGEIANFITDGENGFVAMPNSIESFYSKMLEALSDYDKAKEIGLNGRILAKKVFDYKIQSKLVTDYIIEINNK
jgi:glycosyltransferase involved in cell wall biosynthesis